MPFTFEKCLQLTNASGLSKEDAEDLEVALSSGGGSDLDSLVQDDDGNVQTNFRFQVIGDLTLPGEDPILKVVSNGEDIPSPPGFALDGGVQSFHHGTYDCTAGNRQSFALAGFNESSRSLGANTLTAIGVYGRATAGTNNYSFYGDGGLIRNLDGFNVGAGCTIGEGDAAASDEFLIHCNVTIDSDKDVVLGQKVASFLIPGDAATLPTLGLGIQGGFGRNITMKNTFGPGTGLMMWADDTVAANANVSLNFVRGGVSSALKGGLSCSAGAQFGNETANAIFLWSYSAGSTDAIEFGTGAACDKRLVINGSGLIEVVAGASLKVTGNAGFFGTNPVAKPTGVAVTAAGIHAALVTLGLIGA